MLNSVFNFVPYLRTVNRTQTVDKELYFIIYYKSNTMLLLFYSRSFQLTSSNVSRESNNRHTKLLFTLIRIINKINLTSYQSGVVRRRHLEDRRHKY